MRNPVPLQIHHDVQNGTAVIAVSGRLLLGAEGAELETLVKRLLDEGTRSFIFDFSGLTHIDSTGIGRCIASLNAIMQARGKLHIAGAAGQVRASFRATQLDRIFRFYDDVPAAASALA
jgi:anti-anti-sigma factor